MGCNSIVVLNLKNYIIILLLQVYNYNLYADWDAGIVIKVISGDRFVMKGETLNIIGKYKLACVKADNPNSKRGNFQKKILEKFIFRKKIRGQLLSTDRKYNLINIIDEEKTNKNNLVFISATLVKKGILKRSKDFKECWEEKTTLH